MKNKGKKHDHRVEAEQYPKKKNLVPLPDVLNMDVIATMLDDELMERLRNLEIERDRVLEGRRDPQPWEVEAAYVRRELQLRRQRHAIHEQYDAELAREAREAQRQEDRYPVADLDNSAFMFWN